VDPRVAQFPGAPFTSERRQCLSKGVGQLDIGDEIQCGQGWKAQLCLPAMQPAETPPAIEGGHQKAVPLPVGAKGAHSSRITSKFWGRSV
jgi:hypothetical protein